MKIKLQPQLRLRTVILAVCALILTWLVVSRSLAAYLADVAPQAALWLSPREPDALVNLADQMLNGASAIEPRADTADQSPEPQKKAADSITSVANNGAANSQNQNRTVSTFEIIGQNRSVDLAAVRARAEASLMNEPLNATALRILGQVADIAKDDVGASKFMHAAAQMSLREYTAVYWLMVKSTEAKDYEKTIYYADVFLRTAPELGALVIPILAHIAEDKEAASLLKTVLVSDPPWRGDFFGGLPYNVTDERTPLDLLLALRTSADPPTSADINRYLNFLVAHNLYNLAYYTWLQFLPPDELRSAGLLYNGSFEAAPSGSPFDWVITQGSGVTVDIEARLDKSGENALVLIFQYGRVEYHSVTQLIMLAPGHYQFTGQYKGELVGPRGLKWRVACAENPAKPIAEGAMISGRASAWSDTNLDFTVPEQNCRAQHLSLDLDARMPSELFVTGSMWFDDLRISRVAITPSQ